ncbi:MAG TPA: spherulation-specific family 4 protein, partial [Polyangiaceae bacterium]|nr:spherulation-specific family 4 protein [Polyangiaceae bacterium]
MTWIRRIGRCDNRANLSEPYERTAPCRLLLLLLLASGCEATNAEGHGAAIKPSSSTLASSGGAGDSVPISTGGRGGVDGIVTASGGAKNPSTNAGQGGTSVIATSAVKEPEPSTRLAIPLYIWPDDGKEWSQVAEAGTLVSYLVANAGDPGGPGTAVDSAYTRAIEQAHRVGQRVVGYVDTSYAARSLASVESEIDAWYQFYPAIDGVFLDLTP